MPARANRPREFLHRYQRSVNQGELIDVTDQQARLGEDVLSPTADPAAGSGRDQHQSSTCRSPSAPQPGVGGENRPVTQQEKVMAPTNVSRRKPQLPPQGGVPTMGIARPLVQNEPPRNYPATHEGGPAALISVEQQLRRSVCSCLLWEDEFYEGGQSIANRISQLVAQAPAKTVADLAVDARTHFHLRHVPLLLLASLAAPGRGGTRLIGDAITEAVQRPDEISEFVAVYAKVWGVEPSRVKKRLSAQVKKGLARAFGKFDRYQLAKYFSASGEKEATVRARDVMFLAHPKPADKEQAAQWKKVAAKESIIEGGADTWETRLSSGADKRETWETMLRDETLGYMALLRNLRNMVQAGVDQGLIRSAILKGRGARRVMPFRYITAVRHAPQFENELDLALQAKISDLPVLPGKTAVLVDVSGSMSDKISGKSELSRYDAAAALAALINGDKEVFTFSDRLVHIPNCRGLSGINAIDNSQPHQGTYLGQAISALNGVAAGTVYPTQWVRAGYHNLYLPVQHGTARGGYEAVELTADRLIVITDEQTADEIPAPKFDRAYMINVASAQNGVGYGEKWVHLDGFSEQVIRWVHEYEAL